MKWTIDYTNPAKKQLKSLDKPIRERIINFVKKLSELENPYSIGASLTGGLTGYWKYRVGDYRLLCEINNEKLLVLVVKVGHRREVYKT
ncbi:MAG: type II toxin-antitoxin system RelE/ParE family toxin [Synergistaceae bacterium]|nr:type II toxin-antitoxin system RelE/ParE family toxin [Synergistaceae bacterium]